MKLLLIFLSLTLFECANQKKSIYTSLAQELSNGNQNKTIAVLPFESDSKEFESKHLAEKLTHEFVKSGNYQVIERSKIDRVLKEQSLTQKGITSQDESMKIGKLLSAEGVVVGSIIKENQYITIIARIVDTESGKIWNSSRVTYLSSNSQSSPSIANSALSSDTKQPDNQYKPIAESEKPKAEIKNLQLLRNGKFGRFIGLFRNESKSVLSGNKLFINLKDQKNNFLDTVTCFTDKPAEPEEEVPFSCILSDFPTNYFNHEIFYEPEIRYYGNHSPFKIVSEKFKEDSSFMESYSLTGILENNTGQNITYPKVVLILFDENKKFVGSAVGYGNQKKLSPKESTSFKVTAFSYSLTGKPKTYKVQTHALGSSSLQ